MGRAGVYEENILASLLLDSLTEIVREFKYRAIISSQIEINENNLYARLSYYLQAFFGIYS